MEWWITSIVHHVDFIISPENDNDVPTNQKKLGFTLSYPVDQGAGLPWHRYEMEEFLNWWHCWVPIFYLRLHFSFSPVDILTSTLLLLSIEFTHRLHSPYYLLLLFLDSLTSFYYPSLTTCQFNNYKIFYENCCERLILFAYK